MELLPLASEAFLCRLQQQRGDQKLDERREGVGWFLKIGWEKKNISFLIGHI